MRAEAGREAKVICQERKKTCDGLKFGLHSSMPSHNLNAVETRILGCLLEKERTTPENYPLSLNSLTLACNQATNRDPVVSFDEKLVEAGVNSLRAKKLATVIFGAGSRVQKYRHNLPDHYSFDQ